MTVEMVSAGDGGGEKKRCERSQTRRAGGEELEERKAPDRLGNPKARKDASWKLGTDCWIIPDMYFPDDA